ncbi:putative ArsR family transcriptional regulator [Microlunatus panaciterrae]|uniref:ArsR family transcriptional regulator n=1 Tax=Microlunatus panaciterrae TaxID=400768 RepID=A0ABS2RR59_9ACTN|nr:helix-turn-helix domain-containing protein [Microlunatus panaciterrae]MBM7800419.1 putative ArsR family transcriptional regulator [Microlunatus panaciterrae]
MEVSEPLDPASVTAVAALADDLRRALFEQVRRSHQGLTREQAAVAVGISRKLAAFHLDKLAAVGLLVVRTSGEQRVGRRPHVYQVADATIEVSIPSRRPDLLSEILVTAVSRHRPEESVSEAALRLARELGSAAGEAERRSHRGGRMSPERGLGIVRRVLDHLGYQPFRDVEGDLRLRNCPFDPHATQEPELVCGINRAYLAGLIEGLQATSLQATSPESGSASESAGCCVRVGRTPVG